MFNVDIPKEDFSSILDRGDKDLNREIGLGVGIGVGLPIIGCVIFALIKVLQKVR
jgi:hypothetical protein